MTGSATLHGDRWDLFETLASLPLGPYLRAIHVLRTDVELTMDQVRRTCAGKVRLIRPDATVAHVRAELRAYLEGHGVYTNVLGPIPTLYFSQGGMRADTLRRVAPDVRRAIEHHWHRRDEVGRSDLSCDPAAALSIQIEPAPPLLPYDEIRTSLAELDPLLGEHPEILLGILVATSPTVLADIAVLLDATDPDPRTLLLGFGGTDSARTALELLRDSHRAEIRTLCEARPDYTVAPAHHVVDAFRNLLPSYLAGDTPADQVLSGIGAVYFNDSPRRNEAIRRLAPDIRRVLARHYDPLDRPSTRIRAALDALVHARHEALAKADHLRTELVRLRADADRARAEAEIARTALGSERDAHAATRNALQTLKADRTETERRTRRTRPVPSLPESPLHEHLALLRETATSTAARLARAEAERDQLLGRYLLSGDDPTERSLSGLRVLLVGGWFHNFHEIRSTVEEEGARLIHDNTSPRSAISKLPQADVVVFVVKYLDHPTYHAVKDAAATAGVPFLHWNHRSATSLLRLLRTLPTTQVA